MAPAAAAQMIQERLLLIAFALQMVRAPVNQPRFACTEQRPPIAPEKGRRTGPHSFDHYAIQPPVKGSSGEALGKLWGRLKLKGYSNVALVIEEATATKNPLTIPYQRVSPLRAR